jgi:hypothetical protein
MAALPLSDVFGGLALMQVARRGVGRGSAGSEGPTD